MRISFFPTLLPDETLHSQLSRFHLLSGHNDVRTTLDLFYGSHTHLATSLLPSHLDELVSRIPGFLGITQSQLIECATLLPYYRPFISLAQLARYLQLSSGPQAGALKIGMGMAASRLGGANPFRLCTKCVAADVSEAGVAYWHRAHQLPGVYVCARHEQSLMQPDSFFRHRARLSLFLPALALASTACATVPAASSHLIALTRIANLSGDLLASGMRPVHPSQLQALYLNRAERLGWISKGLRLRVPTIVTAVERLAQTLPDDDDFAFMKTAGSQCAQWALQLLRKHRVCIPPLRHLALFLLLEMDWRCLEDWIACPRPQASARAPAPDPDESTGGGETAAEQEALKALARGECTLTEASRRAGLSVTTLGTRARRESIALNLKPKTLTPNRVAELEQSLASGVSLDALAATSGVSLVSLYRLLRARPKLAQQRASLLQVREVAKRRARYLEDARVKGGRRSPDYAWLYRHDRQFLLEALKACPVKRALKPRIDWEERDKQFSLLIEASIDRLLNINPPARLTKTRLSVSTGRAAVVQKSLARLPLTNAALCRYEESLSAFLTRRSIVSSATYGPVFRHLC